MVQQLKWQKLVPSSHPRLAVSLIMSIKCIFRLGQAGWPSCSFWHHPSPSSSANSTHS